MNKKVCYICGRTIGEKEVYFSHGHNTYICKNDKCFTTAFWDLIAARVAVDKQHRYAVICNKVFEIGSPEDEPRGFGGKNWTIRFFDGTVIETNSLWAKGVVPEEWRNKIKDNAEFVRKDK